MTARTRSWPATTAPRWGKCFWTSPAAASRRRRNERTHGDRGNRAASHQRDGPALLGPSAVVMAAPPGAAVLADAAHPHLGVPAVLHRPECRVFRARRARSGEHRLDIDVRADAARLHLLAGDGAAALAASCRLVVAADLRFRGHAGAVDRPCISN